jgi:dipeptidyl aminopeptidase/acylaminoacyl peptidase
MKASARSLLSLAVLFLLGPAGQSQPTGTEPASRENVIVPGENLEIQGIPPIPASLAAEVNRYINSRSATLASWHPTRREMLIGTRFGDTTQVHRLISPGGARTQLTFSADAIRGASFQPSKGDYFVFSRDRGGDEFYQNYRFDLATRRSTLLTDGKGRNSSGVWSHGGDRLAYTSTRRTGRDTDLYVIDPANPASDRLLCQVRGGGWAPLDWSPDDRTLLVEEYISINETYLWLIDATSGERKPLIDREGTKTAYSQGKFSKDGKGIYVVTDRDGEFRQLAYLDLSSRQLTYLTRDIPWDVHDLDLSSDGKALAVVTNEDGMGVLHLRDAQTGKGLPSPRLPAGSVGIVKWRPGSKELGFTLTSAGTPTDVYSLDLAGDKVERWTFSETGEVNLADTPEPRLIRWKSFDDRMISGYLYTPPARFTGKRPVIINIHGGPESQYRPGFLGHNAYYTNELGIALLYPNIRGSSGYGKLFVQLDNGFHREDAYKDIGALLDWIREQPDLDAERIMVTGGSYGGHMTLVTAVRYNDRIRCSVDVVGISNLATFLKNTQEYRRDLRRAEYGDERDTKMLEFMNQIAPLNQVDRITKPLFIVQGKNDPRVPLSESEQMVAVLRRKGSPVWYLVARDEGHGFRKKKNADFQFYATVRFVQEYLLK